MYLPAEGLRAGGGSAGDYFLLLYRYYTHTHTGTQRALPPCTVQTRLVAGGGDGGRGGGLLSGLPIWGGGEGA